MYKTVERRLVVVQGDGVPYIHDSAAASVEQSYSISGGIFEQKPAWELFIVGWWESGESSYHPPPSARADWKASLISVASKPLSDIAHLHERSDALSR